MPKIGKKSTKQKAKTTRSKVAMKETIQTTLSMKVSETVHVISSTSPGWKLVSFWSYGECQNCSILPLFRPGGSMGCNWDPSPPSADADVLVRQHRIVCTTSNSAGVVTSSPWPHFVQPSPQPRGAMTRVSPDLQTPTYARSQTTLLT